MIQEQPKFMINFRDSFYSFELYSEEGDHIYELEEAVEEASKQYPNQEYEIYNGNEGYSNYE